jgi:E3 ubiquitin-protein ligase TRIP12
MELKVKAKPPQPQETTEGGSNNNNEDGTSPAPPSSSKKSSSLPSDPQDAYVLRSRLIKVKYLTNGAEGSGDAMFESLKNTIKSLASTDASEEQIKKTLKEVSKLFGNTDATISSFELLKSGLLDGLLEFTTATDRTGV